MIQGTIIGNKEILARYRRIRQKAVPALTKRMARVVIKLQAHVVKNKLSGQVLKVRTGTLRRSVHENVEVTSNNITGMVGTNMEYAAYHEYGFEGTVNVREHLRRTKAQAVEYKRSELKGKASNLLATWKAQRQKEATITVRAHTREINYPAHSFLRSASKDLRQDVLFDLNQGFKEVIE